MYTHRSVLYFGDVVATVVSRYITIKISKFNIYIYIKFLRVFDYFPESLYVVVYLNTTLKYPTDNNNE